MAAFASLALAAKSAKAGKQNSASAKWDNTKLNLQSVKGTSNNGGTYQARSVRRRSNFLTRN